MIFDNSYAASAATQPSVASLLTGRRPFAHGFWNVTQPRILQPNLAWWVQSMVTIRSESTPIPTRPSSMAQLIRGGRISRRALSIRPGESSNTQERPCMRGRKAQKFFLHLQLADPHDPYNPPVYEKSFLPVTPIGEHFQPRFAGLSFQNADSHGRRIPVSSCTVFFLFRLRSNYKESPTSSTDTRQAGTRPDPEP